MILDRVCTAANDVAPNAATFPARSGKSGSSRFPITFGIRRYRGEHGSETSSSVQQTPWAEVARAGKGDLASRPFRPYHWGRLAWLGTPFRRGGMKLEYDTRRQ